MRTRISPLVAARNVTTNAASASIEKGVVPKVSSPEYFFFRSRRVATEMSMSDGHTYGPIYSHRVQFLWHAKLMITGNSPTTSPSP